MNDFVRLVLAVYGTVAACWALFGVMAYAAVRELPDGSDDDGLTSAARFTLAAPVWPIVAIWYGGRVVGYTFGRMVLDATRRG